MHSPRKLLSIGHSYAIALNRRLVNEIARVDKNNWEVTAIAPSFLYGDLRPMHLETDPNEVCQLEPVSVYLSRCPHLMTYSWRLKEILQQGWDLVHSWQEPYIFAGGQIAWWTPPQTPLVYRTAQSICKRYPPPFNWIEDYAMSRTTGWICCGQTVADTLKPRKGYSLPMRLIPLGVDIKHFYPSVDAKQQTLNTLAWEQQDTPVIGYLGRLVSDKGLNLLMEVLDTLQTPWRALFIGTGAMESSLLKWGERYPNRVRVCTDVKHSQVPQYLNAMDVLCAPSQTMPNWREQFGRMLIEAFACGVPVIGSDSGEIPNVIQDTGLVVGEKDKQGWVQALSDLLESPSRRQEIAEKALYRAHTTYAWSAIAKQHVEFFNELLSSRF
jgi:glycosyltransferase involved in cell wall biosynthesis